MDTKEKDKDAKSVTKDTKDTKDSKDGKDESDTTFTHFQFDGASLLAGHGKGVLKWELTSPTPSKGALVLGPFDGETEFLQILHIPEIAFIAFVKRQEPTHLVLWDAHKRVLAIEAALTLPIQRIHYHQGYIIAITETNTQVYKLCDLLLQYRVSDKSVTHGRTEVVAVEIKHQKSAYPIFAAGGGRIVVAREKEGECIVLDVAESQGAIVPRVQFEAHEHSLAHVQLSRDGKMLATSSTMGTVIRVFDLEKTRTKVQLYEFRRGAGKAIIRSMSFSDDNKWLVVVSSKLTIHVFCLDNPKLNKSSKLYYPFLFTSYFTSVWSCANLYMSQSTEYTDLEYVDTIIVTLIQ
jgi:hypothetical protein